MTQPTLFTEGEAQIVSKLEATRQRWLKFDAENPQIRAALIRRALKLKRQGVRKFGMQGLIAVVRYLEIRRRTITDEPFEINNSFSPFWSRAIMDDVPELNGFFETRELISANRTTVIQIERTEI